MGQRVEGVDDDGYCIKGCGTQLECGCGAAVNVYHSCSGARALPVTDAEDTLRAVVRQALEATKSRKGQFVIPYGEVRDKLANALKGVSQ